MATIVILLDRLSLGGAAVVSLTLSKALRDLGHRVALIAFDPLCELEVPEGVTHIVVPFEPSGRIQKWRRHRLQAKMLDKVLEARGLNAPDLVLAHLYKTHRVVRESQYLGAKAWFCIHSSLWHEHLASRSFVGRLTRRLKLKSLYSHRVITVSERLAQEVTSIVGARPDHLKTIYNPLDVDRIRQMMEEDLDEDYGDFFVHVGRLDMRSKRHDRLLDYYASSGVSEKLLIIGKGGDEVTIKRQIGALGLGHQVQLVGGQKNPYKFIRRAKALLLTSDYEGFGLVIVESLICGTPVISVDCRTGPSELLTGELSADLIPLADKRAFIERIRFHATHAQSIPERYVERFEARRIASQYADLIVMDATTTSGRPGKQHVQGNSA